MTLTHTHFFNSDALAIIAAEYEKLHDDWLKRSVQMSNDVAIAGDKRLLLLKNAIYFLREDAD